MKPCIFRDAAACAVELPHDSDWYHCQQSVVRATQVKGNCVSLKVTPVLGKLNQSKHPKAPKLFPWHVEWTPINCVYLHHSHLIRTPAHVWYCHFFFNAKSSARVCTLWWNVSLPTVESGLMHGMGNGSKWRSKAARLRFHGCFDSDVFTFDTKVSIAGRSGHSPFCYGWLDRLPPRLACFESASRIDEPRRFWREKMVRLCSDLLS